MAINNPFAGSPDFVRALASAIESIPNAYTRAPQAGGAATSVRMPDERVACLDAVAKASGWTRNEVVNALLDKGLFVLFHELGDSDVEKIMDSVGKQFSPPSHATTNMELHNGHRFSAIARQMRSGRWHPIYQYAMADTPEMMVTSEELKPDFATLEEAVAHGKKLAKEAIERSLTWTIYIKLPLPSEPFGNKTPPGNTLVPPLTASTEQGALAKCREQIRAGYRFDSLHVEGPNDIQWDGYEIQRRLAQDRRA